MSKISIVIPCFNEEENVCEIARAIMNVMDEKLKHYQYDIIFIDNDSQDETRNYVMNILKLKQYLMQKILGSLIRRIMGCANQMGIVQY